MRLSFLGTPKDICQPIQVNKEIPVSFTQEFSLKSQDVVAVIGSGGKTSLCYALAKDYSDRKTVLTTTTKMHEVKKNDIGVDNFYEYYEKQLPKSLQIGVSVFGNFKSHKVCSLPKSELEHLLQCSDLFLYEADGAKGKALKMWRNNEPVILAATTVVIGVLPLHVMGKHIDESFIHRFTLFCDSFGVNTNSKVDKELLINIIQEMFARVPNGLRKIVYCNRENKSKIHRDILERIAKDFADIEFFAGSIEEKSIRRVL